MRFFDAISRGPLRDGFLGIGGGGASTDRGSVLSSRQGLWNVFNQGLGLSNQQNATGQNQQTVGQGSINNADTYWNNLLAPGRTQATFNASPAINNALESSDASKAQSAQFGSGRSGANVSAQDQQQATTTSNVDNIISQSLTGGQQAAASGLAGTGATDLSAGAGNISAALQSLGLSSSAVDAILKNSEAGYEFNTQQQGQMAQSAGQAAAMIALAFM